MAKAPKQYRVQMRQFEELRQWRGPGKVGWTSRTHYGPWKTIGYHLTIERAKEQIANNATLRLGLRQTRIILGTDVVFEQ